MRIRVSVRFPDVVAAHACHVVTLDASHFRIAVNRGLREILKNRHLKGRRIRSGIISFARLDRNDGLRGPNNGNGGTNESSDYTSDSCDPSVSL